MPKPPPPPPAKAPPPPNGRSSSVTRTFEVQRGITLLTHKTGIYGPGGIGKSSLCASLAQVGIEPLFLDLDMETDHLDIARIPIGSWDELLAALRQKVWKGYGAVIIDSGTKAEEYASAWVIANIKHEKGFPIHGIEDYGWGKGYTYVYETFLLLLQELDVVVRAGVHVVMTAHDCVADVPNPDGEDWIRYEPRLQSPKKGKASICLRVKEWANHLVFIGYDVAPEKGKGKGVGTRTIYPTELPTYMAKSRTLSEPIPYEKGSAELWRQMLGKERV